MVSKYTAIYRNKNYRKTQTRNQSCSLIKIQQGTDLAGFYN